MVSGWAHFSESMLACRKGSSVRSGGPRSLGQTASLLGLVSILVPVSLGGCFEPERRETPPPAARVSPIPEVATATSADADILDPETLRRLEPQGLSGDSEAAFKLALHYGADAKSQEERYWLTIAAENGSFSAMQNLSVILCSPTDQRECPRAVFWLKEIKRRAPAAVTKELLVDSSLEHFANGWPNTTLADDAVGGRRAE